MSEKTPIQLLLENRFKQLAKERKENNTMPPELRREVFETLESLENAESEADDVAEDLNGEEKAETLTEENSSEQEEK